MRRTIIAIGIAALVLAAGCGSKKQTGDADADDAMDVTAETDAVDDPAPEPEPDGSPDADPDVSPDVEEDTEEDAEPDVEEDGEEDPGTDAGTDPGTDPGSDGGTDAGSDSTDAGSEPPGCRTLVPGSYGMCDMVLGVGWDGSACVWFSGCSCTPDCAYFFRDMTSCLAACP
jgi:hypothetical protein